EADRAVGDKSYFTGVAVKFVSAIARERPAILQRSRQARETHGLTRDVDGAHVPAHHINRQASGAHALELDIAADRLGAHGRVGVDVRQPDVAGNGLYLRDP